MRPIHEYGIVHISRVVSDRHSTQLSSSAVKDFEPIIVSSHRSTSRPQRPFTGNGHYIIAVAEDAICNRCCAVLYINTVTRTAQAYVNFTGVVPKGAWTSDDEAIT